MNLTKYLLIAATLFAGLLNASAHVSVSGDRTLNSGNAIDGQTFTNNLRTVSSSFGWADGTDANWGDSHRLTAFKFTLGTIQDVTITVARRNAAGQTGATNSLLTAFSLYQTSDYQGNGVLHDTSAGSVNYYTTNFGTGATGESFTDTGSYVAGVWTPGTLNGARDIGESYTDANSNGVYDGPGVGGSGKKGAFLAVNTWIVFDSNPVAASSLSTTFNYVGYAADGTSANFGGAGGIVGDGAADGSVTKTFSGLAAGDYYLFAGGANYFAQDTEQAINGASFNAFPTYGIGVTVGAVPEPTTGALIALGTGALALLPRTRNRKS
ncbi:MAG: hypothetical protein ACOYMS_08555 [Terrimicrobiaceae bacterium]